MLTLAQALPPESELFGEVHVHFNSRKTSLNSSVTLCFINIKKIILPYIVLSVITCSVKTGLKLKDIVRKDSWAHCVEMNFNSFLLRKGQLASLVSCLLRHAPNYMWNNTFPLPVQVIIHSCHVPVYQVSFVRAVICVMLTLQIPEFWHGNKWLYLREKG